MTKRILLITTGGTIACQEDGDNLAPIYDGRYLLSRIPALSDCCDIEVLPLMSLDSSNMTTENRQEIAKAIYDHLPHYDGIVITHGTDTMAYTVALTTFILGDVTKPVVFTGSQIPISHAESDGIMNLYHSFLVAMSPLQQVCLVFHRKIIAGTHVYKMRSLDFNAFESCNYPCLGEIQDDEVLFDPSLQPPARHYGYMPALCDDVFVLKLFPGIRASIVDYIRDNGYRGVILEAYGLGGVPVDNQELLTKLQQLIRKSRIPVFIVTQCVYDGVNLEVYKVGEDLLNIGVLPVGDMTTEAAVSKLIWILGQTQDFDQICTLMQTCMRNEFNHL